MSKPKERPLGVTDRKYDSVAALMRGEGIPTSVQNKVERLLCETRLSLHLARMRQKAGISQKQMAERLGVTQGTISKLEAGTDEHITVKHFRDYSMVTGDRISLMFGKPFSDMESVAILVDALSERLDRLAESANQNEETQDKIKGCLGDACRNILNAVALCNGKLPVKEDDVIQEVRVEIISGKKVIPSSTTSSMVNCVKASPKA